MYKHDSGVNLRVNSRKKAQKGYLEMVAATLAAMSHNSPINCDVISFTALHTC